MNLDNSEILPIALIVMGPSACGKSEIATALSKHYKCEYIDADSLHSPSNIEKMSNGIALTDEDRLPWLRTVREQLVLVHGKRTQKTTENVCVVVACSSLKKSYRDILRRKFDNEDGLSIKTIFIYLNCSVTVLKQRIDQREGHFMKSSLLQSQLNTLEKPYGDELAITVNGDQTLNAIISNYKLSRSNNTVIFNLSIKHFHRDFYCFYKCNELKIR